MAEHSVGHTSALPAAGTLSGERLNAPSRTVMPHTVMPHTVMPRAVRAVRRLAERAPARWLDALAVMAGDAAALILAWALTDGLFGGGSSISPFVRAHGITVMLSLLAWFALVGHYRPGHAWRAETRTVVLTLLATMAFLAFAVVASGGVLSLLPGGGALALSIVLVPVTRHWVRHGLRAVGRWRIPTVIVAPRDDGEALARAMAADAACGYDVLEIVSPDTVYRPDLEAHLLGRYGRDRRLVFLVSPRAEDGTEPSPPAAHVLPIFTRHGFSAAVVPAQPKVVLAGIDLNRVDGLDGGLIAQAGHRAPSTAARVLKRAADVVMALVGLALAAPLFLPIAAMIRSDGGPVFFSQTRIGRGGRLFACLKFRTMVTDASARLEALLASDPNAAEEWARDQKLKSDPRVTAMGEFLRKTSLDELPQLLNILRGEMSLVGPRPVVPDELARYGASAPYYLAVRPGLTGLWQVSGRNNTTYDERVMFDVTYVLNWSFWKDCIIVMRTMSEVLWRRSGF